MTDRNDLIEKATWALIDYDTDVVDRGVRDEHYRERRADVERVWAIFEQAHTPAQDAVTPEPSAEEPIADNRKWVQLHRENKYQREAAKRMTGVLDALEDAQRKIRVAEGTGHEREEKG